MSTFLIPLKVTVEVTLTLQVEAEDAQAAELKAHEVFDRGSLSVKWVAPLDYCAGAVHEVQVKGDA